MNFDIDTLFDSRTELKRHQQSKAMVNLWSSLSDQSHEEFAALLETLGIDHAVTTYRCEDRPGGRSVHRAADQAQVGGRHELDDLSEALGDCAEVLTYQTPNGTGMIRMESIRPCGSEPLDAITRILVVSPSPTDRERICNAFNLATLDRDNAQNVFVSKASHNETPRYPAALGELGTTMVFVDTMNLFCPAVTHGTVPAGGVSVTRQRIASEILDQRARLGRAHNELLGFDPNDWLPPGLAADDLRVWSDNDTRAYLVFPRDYDQTRLTDDLLADDDGIRITSFEAPVDRIRVMLTRELADEFVRTVKVSNVRWLYENAADLDAWRKEVDRECSPTTDPREEVVRFLTEEMNVYDPDVRAALREAGADV
ncbi:hypothetical protein HZS55_04535 [Halosimplex rubrum]|uniref:Uncharacterized protein n=1 Tax=Halosimplex rubrum TaxID=869889 RepID=A0A7D5TBQ2_9EURY|nr:hypothetical protein [Halosimplex rubrum]QLH76616.1 hypothetical protein HZS55_04535 [Halosimplex rubrum]